MPERNRAAEAVRLFDLEPVAQPRSMPTPHSARDLSLVKVTPGEARRYVALWHSRLPDTQRGPWMLAFAAKCGDDAYAGALWHNPSARGLPQDWLELRRLACSPDAPHCTASWMLAAMAKWIKANMPTPRLISYQDTAVHKGTIYKAAGWTDAYVSQPRTRDRSSRRAGTTRAYRTNLNGEAPATAAKVRWEKVLH